MCCWVLPYSANFYYVFALCVTMVIPIKNRMSDGFIKVTRKKWIACKGVRNPKGFLNIENTINSDDAENVDIDRFLKKLSNVCLQMQASEYFKRALDKIGEAVVYLEDCNEINILNGQYFERLVCFGIGAFTRSYHSLHQLAFVLCSIKYYKIKDAVFFDPILQVSEKKILQRLECTLMNENCEAKYEADVKTLFYLPHCARCLTNNLLWSNWNEERLKNMVLINNSFERLSNHESNRILREEFESIADIMPYTIEISINDDYYVRATFNDLSVHIFPLRQLPPRSSKFWLERKQPLYRDSDAILVFNSKDRN